MTIVRHCKELRHLGLRSCKHTSEKVVLEILNNCKYLEILQTPCCSRLHFKRNANDNQGEHKRMTFKVLGRLDCVRIDHTPTMCDNKGCFPYVFSSRMITETLNGKYITYSIQQVGLLMAA